MTATTIIQPTWRELAMKALANRRLTEQNRAETENREREIRLRDRLHLLGIEYAGESRYPVEIDGVTFGVLSPNGPLCLIKTCPKCGKPDHSAAIFTFADLGERLEEYANLPKICLDCEANETSAPWPAPDCSQSTHRLGESKNGLPAPSEIEADVAAGRITMRFAGDCAAARVTAWLNWLERQWDNAPLVEVTGKEPVVMLRCQTCGEVPLSPEDLVVQYAHPKDPWCCPNCGRPAKLLYDRTSVVVVGLVG